MTHASVKYERMLSDLRMDLRPQREWGEGRGLFLVIGHFVVGIAAGAWLFALIFDRPVALVAAFALAALGGLAHLGFLGKPDRFWRMSMRARTSWISRGFIGLSLFLAGAALYLAPQYLPGTPWGSESLLADAGYAMALVGMVVLMGYMGFVYTSAKAIPFWNSPLHPALYVAYALRGGVAALFVTALADGGASELPAVLLPLWGGITVLVALFFMLEIHGALTSGNEAARRSVHDLLAGRVAVYFYGGTLVLGLFVPAYLMYTGLTGPLSIGAMALLGVSSAIGDFFMKYATIRAGVRLPVWTHLTPQRR
ncbi:polysulfide reductase NrfD [Aromatoleum toluclasticum]|uniref:NrfD/PsrC family molybdoenzyme membrane anchor subunit n=1 Tax=Aromatoleum toluclasticum TaxID=92003 RepID=UPI001D17FD7B|nr:NrfD/PsrC family molybdoenzyme membrane anchor subunit [Aromatoleum toluclasticum]MCC4114927.1 polysulfide reductase NrfD [Aromatoleum toluclasticum]